MLQGMFGGFIQGLAATANSGPSGFALVIGTVICAIILILAYLGLVVLFVLSRLNVNPTENDGAFKQPQGTTRKEVLHELEPQDAQQISQSGVRPFGLG